ncbi:MAG: GNAT family N-acetyltransferase [Saprospiraceae bacterium]
MNEETLRLRIRPFAWADADDYFVLESDPELFKYELSPPKSRQESDDVLKRLLLSDLSPDIQNWREWAIELKSEEKVIGLISMSYHDVKRRMLEVGFRVRLDCQRMGYGSEALRGVIAAIFRDTETHRIFACTDGLNIASQKMMEKAGMQREGHLRENVPMGDEYHDEVIYGVLRREAL